FGSQLQEGILEELKQQITFMEEKNIKNKMIPIQGSAAIAFQNFQQLSWQGRFKDILSRMFPSLAFMQERYGFSRNGLALICYPLRWFELGQKFWIYIKSKYWRR
ncbi:MAG: hypothetical protein ACPL1K_03415, partial [Candidatus Kryptoniota bacterium]